MQDPLITLDEAVTIAKEAGFSNMNKRWFERKIETGALDGRPGAVMYVLRSDVQNLIDTVLAHAAAQAKSPA